MMTVLCLTSSSLVLHQVYSFHEFYTWVPRGTRHQLLVAAVSKINPNNIKRLK